MIKTFKKNCTTKTLTTLAISAYLIGISCDVFAETAKEAQGVDILKTSLTSLKTMLLGDARQVIDACIVTAGAGGAVMAKNWSPIALSAVAVVGYELLCKSLA